MHESVFAVAIYLACHRGAQTSNGPDVIASDRIPELPLESSGGSLFAHR
jgi:hypothetical protein